MGCYYDVPVWWDVLSSDWQQHRRHEENMEPQIHIEEPFRRDPRFDVSPRRAGSHHRFRGPHAQDVESAEDGSCQKVRTSPSSVFQTLTHRFLLARSRRVLDIYWFPVGPFMFCSVRYVNTQSALCSVQALYTWRSRPSTIREKSSVINESQKEDSLRLLPNCHTIQPHETLPVRQRADDNLLYNSHDVTSRFCSPHTVWSHVMGLFLEAVSRLL